MAEESRTSETGGTSIWRRRSLWLGGGALVALAGFAAVAPSVLAYGFGGHGFGGHGFGRHGGFGHGRLGAQILKDPQAAKQHAGMAVEWALRGVNATDEQKQQARRITDKLVDDLGPLAAQHRDNRDGIHRAISGGEIDREAIEQLRRQELALADQASKLAVNAFVDLAFVLTPDQRTELLAFAHRLHGGD